MADEGRGWSVMERRATWVLLALLWLGSLGMVARDVGLGWLAVLLALWMSAGLIYTGWFMPGTLR